MSRWETYEDDYNQPIPFKQPDRIEKANFPVRYKDCTIDTFPTEHPKQRELVENLHRYLTNWTPLRNLILQGRVGLGKTGLAISIGKELISQYKQCVKFLDCAELAIEYSKDYKSDVIVNKYKNYDVLILDDIDKANTEGFWKLCFALVKYRYDNEKCTLATTNGQLGLSKNAYIEPIYDRLQEPPGQVETLIEWESLRR